MCRLKTAEDVEDDRFLRRLRTARDPNQIVRPHVEEIRTPDGRRLYLLAQGRVVNLAAAEGHPAAVMDVIFACQALAAEHLVKNRGALEPGVQPLPDPIDAEVARLKLESMGVEIDALTPAQRTYLSTWTR